MTNVAERIIFWGMLVVVHALLCQGGEGHLLTHDCQLCHEDYYVKVNCTVQADGRVSGVQCGDCSKCTGEGQTIIVPCSAFSDSVCGCVSGARLNSTGHCETDNRTIVTPAAAPGDPDLVNVRVMATVPRWD